MNQIQKVLVAITILVLVAPVSIANQNIPTNENLSGTEINGNGSVKPEDMPVEEQVYVTEKPDSKTIKERFLNRSKSLGNFNRTGPINVTAIPATIATDISYTNPITGISTFGTPISEDIYTNDWVNYANIDFYLPSASYVYVDFRGTYYLLGEWSIYDIYVDGIQMANGANYNICNAYCGTDFGKSTTVYLTKGWHYVSVDGYAYRYSDYYQVRGYLSVLAFPEYTAITVLVPNGGETWYRGQTKTITWKKDGNPGANVKIELYKGTALSMVISSKTANDGSYSWYIPTYIPTGTDYKIKISSYEEPTKYSDWSNNNFKLLKY